MDDFAAKPGTENLFHLIQGEANAIQPGKRPVSSMTPTIVLRDGKLFLVLGAPGGSRIINGVLQVILNVVDFHMNVQDAVDWPRFHHQWMPDVLYVEKGISPDTVALLRAMGHNVSPLEATDPVVARVEAILNEGGWLQGAADRTRQRERPKDTDQMDHVLSTHLFVNHRLNTVWLDQHLAGGHSGGGDFLRAPASGLSRPRADQRTGPLVPRFQVEAALAALADVQRRYVGPVRPQLAYQHLPSR